MCGSIAPIGLRESSARHLVRANPTVSPEGLARDLLVTILSGPNVLVLPEAILTEVQRVMTYPRVQARWLLSTDAIERYASFLRDSGAIADLPFLPWSAIQTMT